MPRATRFTESGFTRVELADCSWGKAKPAACLPIRNPSETCGIESRIVSAWSEDV